VEEGSGTGVSRYRGPVGGPGEGVLPTENFEKWMKGSLGMGRLSLKRLAAEDFEGGLLYWGPWKIRYERLQIRASLSTGAPLSPTGT